MEDSIPAREFIAQLPLTLQLEDYAATEKIAQLPRPLSVAGEPEGVTPAAGDIAFYAPVEPGREHGAEPYGSGSQVLRRSID